MARIAVGIFVATLACCDGAQAGLVSLWSGETNANDSVGANHGVVIPTVNYTPGVIGQGFLFPDSGYLDIPNPAAGGLISPDSFSFAAWVRFDGADPPPAGGPGAIIQYGSTSSGFLLRQAGSNTVGFYVNTSGMSLDYAIIDTGSTSPPTFWNFGELSHIAATFDAGTHSMALYKNGELVASRADVPGGNMAVHPGDVFFIGRENLVGATLDGMLDDVRFYDHALSGPEVAALVPEPSTGLLLVGFMALSAWRRANRPPLADLRKQRK